MVSPLKPAVTVLLISVSVCALCSGCRARKSSCVVYRVDVACIDKETRAKIDPMVVTSKLSDLQLKGVIDFCRLEFGSGRFEILVVSREELDPEQIEIQIQKPGFITTRLPPMFFRKLVSGAFGVTTEQHDVVEMQISG